MDGLLFKKKNVNENGDKISSTSTYVESVGRSWCIHETNSIDLNSTAAARSSFLHSSTLSNIDHHQLHLYIYIYVYQYSPTHRNSENVFFLNIVNVDSYSVIQLDQQPPQISIHSLIHSNSLIQ